MKSIENKIVTGNFDEVEKLSKQDFLLVSILGKVYGEYKHKEELEMLRGFSTYRMRYHLQAQDYLSCYLLYNSILERKGIEKILEQLEELTTRTGKSKIALLGYGKGNEFDYRHIFSDFLQRNGIRVSEYSEEIDMNMQKRLWQYDPYKERGQDGLTDEYVGELLEVCKWIFAATMTSNPHHYTLRKDFENNSLFLSIVKHIRFYGKLEVFGGMIFRCFYWKNHKYFTYPADLIDFETDLINQVKIL